jgi:hypothetical protein
MRARYLPLVIIPIIRLIVWPPSGPRIFPDYGLIMFGLEWCGLCVGQEHSAASASPIRESPPSSVLDLKI